MSTIPDPSTHVFSEWILHGDFYYQARDIIGFGYKLNTDNVIDAYRKGVFPWPIDEMPLPWFCPEKRAILNFPDLHVSKSLQKTRRISEFTFTVDKDFSGVIEGCSEVPRSGQDGTWITEEYKSVYTELHETGVAHSVETWHGSELVGGLYGIDAGGVFCGESMFFKQPNASKLALLHLIDRIREAGGEWIDIQVMTPHMKKFGAVEITRNEFLKRLAAVQEKDRKLFH